MMVVVRVALAMGLAGCIGSVGGDGTGSSNSTIDAASGTPVDAPKLMWVDAAPGTGNNLPCKNLVSPAPQNGHHNTGQSCFQSCHNHGFTVAGTLYTNATGNTGFGGATISLTDNNGAKIDIVVNSDGNFYTSQAVAFPALTIASACPSAVKMPLATANGNCNASNCHATTANQMHLP